MSSEGRDVIKALAFTVASTAVTVIVFRVLTQPDAFALTRMKAFKAAESMCQNNARGWANAADTCLRLYDSSRAVVV